MCTTHKHGWAKPLLWLYEVNRGSRSAEALGSHDMLHRVVLVRSAQSIDRLPEALRNSNVIKMTVAEAKGLEFDDVFLLDFFNDSPAEWRNLNNFVAELEEIEETQGSKKLPAGSPLVDVRIKPSALLVLPLWQQYHTQSSIHSLLRPCNAFACGPRTGKGCCTEDIIENRLPCITAAACKCSCVQKFLVSRLGSPPRSHSKKHSEVSAHTVSRRGNKLTPATVL